MYTNIRRLPTHTFFFLQKPQQHIFSHSHSRPDKREISRSQQRSIIPCLSSTRREKRLTIPPPPVNPPNPPKIFSRFIATSIAKKGKEEEEEEEGQGVGLDTFSCMYSHGSLDAPRTRPSSFLWMGVSARTHQCWVLALWRISGCTHTKRSCQILHGPRYSPINICTWGYREISWKRAHPLAPPRPPSPLSLHFADQIPLSRSRILALYWCVYVYPTPPFLRMCARRLYNRGEEGEEEGYWSICVGQGKFDIQRRGRRGGSVAFGRNFAETGASFG